MLPFHQNLELTAKTSQAVMENAEKNFVGLLQQSIAVRVVALVAVLACLFGVCLAVVSLFAIENGVLAAGIAMAGSLFAGLLTAVIGQFFSGENKPLFQLGFGMAIRLLGLLGLALFVRFRMPQLVDAGFVFFLLVFYGADLLLETVTLIGGISTAQPSVRPTVHEVAG